MPLTKGVQVDEHRQAAEIKLADREHRLGILLDNYARDFPRLFNRTGRP